MSGTPSTPEPAGRADPALVTGTLTTRAVLAGCLVALVSVLATALVSVPLANQAARRQAAQALAAEANLIAAVLRTRSDPGAAAERAVPQLARQGIALWLVTGGTADRPGLPDTVLDPLRAGRPVSVRAARVAGTVSLVEGRLLGGGDAVVLTRPFATGIGAAVLPRLWLPLLAGLVAGALAGALLARQLSRPLRRAAAAATRLRGGDRRVRVPVDSPAEVAGVAHALNDLAAALATSEARQREFLLSVSHELRTPLTTIKGYAEAFADGVVDGVGVTRTGRVMLAEAEHLERLIADLLALARLEADDFPLQVGPVDLAALVAETAAAWAPRFAAAGLVWRCETPDGGAGSLVVSTDRDRLRQVVDGLLGNALRVVPAGAPVVLRLAGAGTAMVVEVRDGGPGFTDDDVAVAFQRGALTARYRGVRKVGSGLGLALAARLVRRLGGTITAGHAPEGGVRFTVTIPS